MKPIWAKFLSSNRLAWPPTYRHDGFRSEFQRDYDRIIFTSAFRRLQDKTQVFPLAQSDYVRTRLTHTLEVSCVARNLATSVGQWLEKEKQLPDDLRPSDLGDICAAASLAHDLGNPPFGHCGEDAIQEWFKSSQMAREIRKSLSGREALDFENYEGNAHAFRIATRLMMPDSSSGLQLTMATLGALVKYPIQAHEKNPIFKNRVSAKKFNFFQAELPLFSALANKLGLAVNNSSENWWARHPLAFITEAADDIAYRIVDFEDGCRLGIVSYDEAHKYFFDLISDKAKFSFAEKKIRYEKERVEYWRSISLIQLSQECLSVFSENIESIINGSYDEPLLDKIKSRDALEAIKQITKAKVYKNRRVLEIEAAGYDVIFNLLDIFSEALLDVHKHAEKASHYHKKIVELLPAQCVNPRGKPIKNEYHLLLVVADFVAGMTDSYAVSLYRTLLGVQMPG